jgi:prevent-host-death family protein
LIEYAYDVKEVGFLAYIRPSSDLRNKYNEISEFCNRYNEPVFITKNGTGDLVVLSNAEYERLCGKQELYRLLDEGIADIKNGKCRTAEDTFADIEKRFGFGNV